MFEVVEKIFIRLLLFVVLPLVIISAFVAIAEIKEIKKRGRLVGVTVSCFSLATVRASVTTVFVETETQPKDL